MYISSYVIVICVSAYVLHVVARCKQNNAFVSQTIVNVGEIVLHITEHMLVM